MITITYKGKTYKSSKWYEMLVEKDIDFLIDSCFLEEVKENKEPQFTPWQEEQVTIPEYKPPASIIYPNVGMEDIAMELSKWLIHLYELTHFLHSQFPNSKPK